jgi:hypothetical protein
MSLHVLAFNLKRMIALLGAQPLIQAMRPPEPSPYGTLNRRHPPPQVLDRQTFERS